MPAGARRRAAATSSSWSRWPRSAAIAARRSPGSSRGSGSTGSIPGGCARCRPKRPSSAPRAPTRRRQAAEDKRRKALGLFLRGAPIKDTPVELYLKTRGISLEALGRVPNALAFHPEVWNVEAGRKLPCMLAAVVRQGRHIATHRTWIAPDGRGGWTKADLEEPKKVLGSFKGGHIPLSKGACRKTLEEIDAGVDVYASEGIEDGLSVAIARPSCALSPASRSATSASSCCPTRRGAW
jgi:hypothetical protein